MSMSARLTSTNFIGTVETGGRGLILRADDGVAWRLIFPGGVGPDGLSGRISLRGCLVADDRIEVEYFAALP